jgi:hypothetical protein
MFTLIALVLEPMLTKIDGAIRSKNLEFLIPTRWQGVMVCTHLKVHIYEA